MGESADFDAFYAGTHRRLTAQLYAMTGNVSDAEECVQEAYARAWQHWDSVRAADDPQAWIRTVAWRVAASRWRKAAGRVRAHRRHGPDREAPEPSGDAVLLAGALRRIQAEQRRAIVLHHLVGLSVDEVAAETRAPTGTVKARLSRGRAALAVLLADDEHPHPSPTTEQTGGRRAR